MRWIRESFAAKLFAGLLGTVGILLAATWLVVRAETGRQVQEATERAVGSATTQFRQLEEIQRRQLERVARPLTLRRIQAALDAAIETGDRGDLVGQVIYELDLAALDDVLVVFTDADGRPILTTHGTVPMEGADPADLAVAARSVLESGAADPETLRKMFTQAIASGDIESAKSLGEVLKVIENRTNKPIDTGAYMVQGDGVNPETGKPEKYLIDRRTGEIKWTGVAPTPPASSGEVENQRRFQREASLVDDYRAETRPVIDAYNFIDTSLENASLAKAGDPTAQVGLMYAFVKAMDPNSVVREGEIRLANAAAPVWARAQALYQDYVQGKSPAIPLQMVDQMVTYMKKMQAQKEDYMGQIYNNYTERAGRWGVDSAAFRAPPKKYGTAPDPFADLIPGR